MKERVLILGAGATGLVIANKLSRELRREIARDEVEIKVLDKDEVFINQAGFTFLPFNLYTPDDLKEPRNLLTSPRVEGFFGDEGKVVDIDLDGRCVEVKTGDVIDYDYLVIALGSEPDLESVQGTTEELNTFYTSLEDALDLKDRLMGFQEGEIIVMVPEITVSCPGAPCKFSILLSDYLEEKRDVDMDKISFSFLWPREMIGPPALNDNFESACKDRDIDFVENFSLDMVDREKRVVVGGEKEFEYDLLITIPPFKSPEVVSEITNEEGWISVDKRTLEYIGGEGYPDVYAVGDITDLPIPKTGIAGYFQALSVSQTIINKIKGNGFVSKYNGEAGCPILTQKSTPNKDGKAYIPIWTYEKPPKPFDTTSLGYKIYRMYYNIYPDAELKGLI